MSERATSESGSHHGPLLLRCLEFMISSGFALVGDQRSLDASSRPSPTTRTDLPLAWRAGRQTGRESSGSTAPTREARDPAGTTAVRSAGQIARSRQLVDYGVVDTLTVASSDGFRTTPSSSVVVPV